MTLINDDLTGLHNRRSFLALLRRYDPDGKFRNEFMDRYFPAAP